MALVAASAATISFDLHVSLSLRLALQDRRSQYTSLPPLPLTAACTHSQQQRRRRRRDLHTAAAAADQITWPPHHTTPSHTGRRYHITITGQHCNRPQTDGRSCRDPTSNFVSWTHCENYGAISLRASGLIASSYWCVVRARYWILKLHKEVATLVVQEG